MQGCCTLSRLLYYYSAIMYTHTPSVVHAQPIVVRLLILSERCTRSAHYCMSAHPFCTLKHTALYTLSPLLHDRPHSHFAHRHSQQHCCDRTVWSLSQQALARTVVYEMVKTSKLPSASSPCPCKALKWACMISILRRPVAKHLACLGQAANGNGKQTQSKKNCV